MDTNLVIRAMLPTDAAIVAELHRPEIVAIGQGRAELFVSDGIPHSDRVVESVRAAEFRPSI